MGEKKDHNFWIPFHVVACTSEEPGTNVELLSTTNKYSEKSWESSRTSDYPIEIILRFHYRVQIEHILMATKPEKHIPAVEFHIGDGLGGSFVDVEYRESGKLENVTTKVAQAKVYGIGSYLKLIIRHPQKKSSMNPFGQISIGTLKVWGKPTGYYTKIKNEQLPLTRDKSEIDKILIGLGMPLDLIHWFEEDDRNFEYAPIDDETRITLTDMQKIREKALHSEDFEALKQLSFDIKSVFEIGKELFRLRHDLEFAIAKENFSDAIDLRNKIKRLESRRDGFDALYETSRYEQMIVMQRPSTAEIALAQQLWEEEQRRHADALRRQRELEEQERRRLLEEERARMKLKDEPISYEPRKIKTPPKNRGKKKKEPEKIEDFDVFKNPLNFNEGDVDLDIYFKPLFANIGDKSCDHNVELLRRLFNMGYLTVFGARVWCAIYCDNWRHREAAAQAVLNFLEMPLPEKYLNGKSKKLFLAAMEFAKVACDDKILQIYFIGLKILTTALSPPVCGTDVSPLLINKVLREFLPILLEKISELNFRARDISMHTLISIFKHPAARVGVLLDSTIDIGRMDPNFPTLFVPVDKQQMRIVLARLEILLQLVQEFGYDQREWNWVEPFNLLIVPSLFHSNADIRLVATELVVAFFQLIGEEVREAINKTENLKPMMLEQINAKLKSVEEIAFRNQKLRETQLEVVQEQDQDESPMRMNQKMEISLGERNARSKSRERNKSKERPPSSKKTPERPPTSSKSGKKGESSADKKQKEEEKETSQEKKKKGGFFSNLFSKKEKQPPEQKEPEKKEPEKKADKKTPEKKTPEKKEPEKKEPEKKVPDKKKAEKKEPEKKEPEKKEAEKNKSNPGSVISKDDKKSQIKESSVDKKGSSSKEKKSESKEKSKEKEETSKSKDSKGDKKPAENKPPVTPEKSQIKDGKAPKKK